MDDAIHSAADGSCSSVVVRAYGITANVAPLPPRYDFGGQEGTPVRPDDAAAVGVHAFDVPAVSAVLLLQLLLTVVVNRAKDGQTGRIRVGVGGGNKFGCCCVVGRCRICCHVMSCLQSDFFMVEVSNPYDLKPRSLKFCRFFLGPVAMWRCLGQGCQLRGKRY